MERSDEKYRPTAHVLPGFLPQVRSSPQVRTSELDGGMLVDGGMLDGGIEPLAVEGLGCKLLRCRYRAPRGGPP